MRSSRFWTQHLARVLRRLAAHDDDAARQVDAQLAQQLERARAHAELVRHGARHPGCSMRSAAAASVASRSGGGRSHMAAPPSTTTGGSPASSSSSSSSPSPSRIPAPPRQTRSTTIFFRPSPRTRLRQKKRGAARGGGRRLGRNSRHGRPLASPPTRRRPPRAVGAAARARALPDAPPVTDLAPASDAPSAAVVGESSARRRVGGRVCGRRGHRRRGPLVDGPAGRGAVVAVVVDARRRGRRWLGRRRRRRWRRRAGGRRGARLLLEQRADPLFWRTFQVAERWSAHKAAEKKKARHLRPRLRSCCARTTPRRHTGGRARPALYVRAAVASLPGFARARWKTSARSMRDLVHQRGRERFEKPRRQRVSVPRHGAPVRHALLGLLSVISMGSQMINVQLGRQARGQDGLRVSLNPSRSPRARATAPERAVHRALSRTRRRSYRSPRRSPGSRPPDEHQLLRLPRGVGGDAELGVQETQERDEELRGCRSCRAAHGLAEDSAALGRRARATPAACARHGARVAAAGARVPRHRQQRRVGNGRLDLGPRAYFECPL